MHSLTSSESVFLPVESYAAQMYWPCTSWYLFYVPVSVFFILPHQQDIFNMSVRYVQLQHSDTNVLTPLFFVLTPLFCASLVPYPGYFCTSTCHKIASYWHYISSTANNIEPIIEDSSFWSQDALVFLVTSFTFFVLDLWSQAAVPEISSQNMTY